MYYCSLFLIKTFISNFIIFCYDIVKFIFPFLNSRTAFLDYSTAIFNCSIFVGIVSFLIFLIFILIFRHFYDIININIWILMWVIVFMFNIKKWITVFILVFLVEVTISQNNCFVHEVSICFGENDYTIKINKQIYFDDYYLMSTYKVLTQFIGTKKHINLNCIQFSNFEKLFSTLK